MSQGTLSGLGRSRPSHEDGEDYVRMCRKLLHKQGNMNCDLSALNNGEKDNNWTYEDAFISLANARSLSIFLILPCFV